jgi:hypothetical protein
LTARVQEKLNALPRTDSHVVIAFRANMKIAFEFGSI